MTTEVKPRRRYDSSRRQAQARLTRHAILAAARDLFLGHGYAGTRMAEVARAADVSIETVYKAFQNKSGLLKALFDVAIAGDDHPIPMLQRELVNKIRAEPDPRQKLLMYGEHLSEAGARAGSLQLLIRSAAASDPEVSAVWDQMVQERLIGMTEFGRDLSQGGHLRPGVTLEDARDVLWTYNSVELFDLLVLQRGWAPDRYGRWIAEAMIAALLPDA
jgi:AcrR family transcriptional regulator